MESRPGVWTVAAESVGEVARERQIATVFERLRVVVRDAAALGISEDDLWAGLDSEFERIPSSNAFRGRTKDRYNSACADEGCDVGR